jgi:hypothetical protein
MLHAKGIREGRKQIFDMHTHTNVFITKQDAEWVMQLVFITTFFHHPFCILFAFSKHFSLGNSSLPGGVTHSFILEGSGPLLVQLF